jgi:hypothetical protein
MENNEDQKKSKGTLWIVLLLISAILNIYQWRNHTTTINSYEEKVDTLIIERVNVEKELSETKSELNKYQGISANLDSLLNEANGKITDMEAHIKTITRSNKNAMAMNEDLKKQLADLQILRDEYLNKIDSLLTANKQLTEEKQQLTSTVENLSHNLESTVNTASVLKAEYFKTQSFKRKGSGKFVETSLAKRTHKFNICFDLLDNKIAKPGERTVYVKITEPGGKVMGNRSEGSNSFKMASGEEILYTASTTVDYTGAKQNICIPYEEQNDKMFPAGTYLIETFVDGNLAGASSYVMK